jgi:hypothetical protein
MRIKLFLAAVLVLSGWVALLGHSQKNIQLNANTNQKPVFDWYRSKKG